MSNQTAIEMYREALNEYGCDSMNFPNSTKVYVGLRSEYEHMVMVDALADIKRGHKLGPEQPLKVYTCNVYSGESGTIVGADSVSATDAHSALAIMEGRNSDHVGDFRRVE